jgi:hypothetical protein
MPRNSVLTGNIVQALQCQFHQKSYLGHLSSTEIFLESLKLATLLPSASVLNSFPKWVRDKQSSLRQSQSWSISRYTRHWQIISTWRTRDVRQAKVPVERGVMRDSAIDGAWRLETTTLKSTTGLLWPWSVEVCLYIRADSEWGHYLWQLDWFLVDTDCVWEKTFRALYFKDDTNFVPRHHLARWYVLPNPYQYKMEPKDISFCQVLGLFWPIHRQL